jgi:hypothetical protein
VKIILKSNDAAFTLCCCICGEYFQPENAIALALNDTTEDRQYAYGAVCRPCIVAGPDGMKRRAFERADKQAIQARQAAEWAQAIAATTIDAPSAAQYELAIDRFVVQACGMTRELLEAEHDDREPRSDARGGAD